MTGIQDHITNLGEINIAVARLNDTVNEKEKNGIFLLSLSEEFVFLAIRAEKQNMDYESICAILKADAEIRKNY